MNAITPDRASFGNALQLLLSQQRDELRTILALSDTSRRHDAASTRAALAEIICAAERCHLTYRAMLIEFLARQRGGCVSRGTWVDVSQLSACDLHIAR